MSSKKTREKKDRGLPFFGVGKILPFVKPYRRTLIVMVICGLLGSVKDIGMPLFQRYLWELTYSWARSLFGFSTKRSS